ncbi:septation protein SepH [Gephyromycinifex aptenodytis]|uniref:septation protein SepH n=1 Tax=Gephyromycinifex aptenodytis TaxID=2716227 RepID=UPI001444CD20|nr:septation protein SepH [Gephyromycinifex aptenodytis]
MQELQLVGVHEDGDYLVLASADGQEEYRLTIDDTLRSAIRFQAAHPEGLRVPHGPVGPVEVQAMIRAGASAEEAAQRAGWSVEKVRRYEGPILAEREHIAQIATGARLRPRGIASGAPILRDRVERRLSAQGVDVEGIFWDSRRDEDGHWTVELHWSLGGRQHVASWHFTKSSMTLRALDAPARALSEDEADQALDLVTQRRHEEPEQVPAQRPTAAAPPALHDPDSDLMSSMREHSRVRTRRGGPRRVASAPTTTTPRMLDDADLAPRADQPRERDTAGSAAHLAEANPTAAPASFQDTTSRGPGDAAAAPESALMDEPLFPLEEASRPEPALPGNERQEPGAQPAGGTLSLSTDPAKPAQVPDRDAQHEQPAGTEAGAETREAPEIEEGAEAGSVESEPEAPSAAAAEQNEPAPTPVEEGTPPLLTEHEQPAEAARPVDEPSPAPEPSQESEAPSPESAPTEDSEAANPSTQDVPDPQQTAPRQGRGRKRSQRNRRAKAPTTTPAPAAPIMVEGGDAPAAQSQPTQAASAEVAGSDPEVSSQSAPAPAPRAPAPSRRPRQEQKPDESQADQPAQPAATPPNPATDPGEDDQASEQAPPQPRPKRSRARRASVPAWDDIMFGTKPGTED